MICFPFAAASIYWTKISLITMQRIRPLFFIITFFYDCAYRAIPWEFLTKNWIFLKTSFTGASKFRNMPCGITS